MVYSGISYYVIQHFVTFPEVVIVMCSRKYLFLKYGRKIRAECLEMLEAAVFFRGLPVLMASSLRQLLQTYSEICNFCSAIRHIVSKKQPVRSAHEVSVDSSETFFDKAHFIVDLQLPPAPSPPQAHLSPK